MNFRDSGGWEATIFLNPNVRMDTGLRFRMEFPASKSFWMLSLKISHIWCLGKKILEARDRDTDIPEVKKKKSTQMQKWMAGWDLEWSSMVHYLLASWRSKPWPKQRTYLIWSKLLLGSNLFEIKEKVCSTWLVGRGTKEEEDGGQTIFTQIAKCIQMERSLANATHIALTWFGGFRLWMSRLKEWLETALFKWDNKKRW